MPGAPSEAGATLGVGTFDAFGSGIGCALMKSAGPNACGATVCVVVNGCALAAPRNIKLKQTLKDFERSFNLRS
jgi:hypothetical protein